MNSDAVVKEIMLMGEKTKVGITDTIDLNAGTASREVRDDVR